MSVTKRKNVEKIKMEKSKVTEIDYLTEMVLSYVDDYNNEYQVIPISNKSDNSSNILIAKKIDREIKVSFNRSVFTPHERTINESMVILFIVNFLSSKIEQYLEPYVNLGCNIVNINYEEEINEKFEKI